MRKIDFHRFSALLTGKETWTEWDGRRDQAPSTHNILNNQSHPSKPQAIVSAFLAWAITAAILVVVFQFSSEGYERLAQKFPVSPLGTSANGFPDRRLPDLRPVRDVTYLRISTKYPETILFLRVAFLLPDPSRVRVLVQ
jgi:hypothetical protein